ncbi:hypothetical protein BCR34DRAFT_483536 [Clohesyomyces aquaticus]|uniref:Nucleic acid-binding protein n=1 Tax=Clohesyomyces aquaticus TaxID=1231657 RepID=A0A1Y1ZPQ3_9PLEO|nr:hypothetical protein BCR34DRAFT_483536 [Clohesyomyces aquaticus]
MASAAKVAATTASKFINPFLSKPIVPTFKSTSKLGVVVSAGKMKKAVKVRIAGQEWNRDIRKYFPSSKTYLCADPTSSLVVGDLIRMSSGWRTSKSIRHVVTAIVAPYGTPINERTPIPTESERIAQRIQQRLLKDVRRAEMGKIVAKLRIEAAKEKGYEVPGLEEAMRNVRIMEEREREKGTKGQVQVKGGKEGQVGSARERRRVEREKTEGERKAEKKVMKEARERTT